MQGNAQPLDATVYTPSGSVKMGALSVGDEVLTPAGKVAKVTDIYPRGVRPVYKVKRRDGSQTRACNEHLWKVQLSDEDMRKWEEIVAKESA